MAARQRIGLPSARGTKLVVVPTHQFGTQAESRGFIDVDEVWCELTGLDVDVRGRSLTAWRYLDTLDQPPTNGASEHVIEAWLARSDESPFPPLDSQTKFQLDFIVGMSIP